jgi:hypothetical protein
MPQPVGGSRPAPELTVVEVHDAACWSAISPQANSLWRSGCPGGFFDLTRGKWK